MKISDLAKAAGVNVETIRYYERRGLITQPLKPEQGYRDYPETTLERVQFSLSNAPRSLALHWRKLLTCCYWEKVTVCRYKK